MSFVNTKCVNKQNNHSKHCEVKTELICLAIIELNPQVLNIQYVEQKKGLAIKLLEKNDKKIRCYF